MFITYECITAFQVHIGNLNSFKKKLHDIFYITDEPYFLKHFLIKFKLSLGFCYYK